MKKLQLQTYVMAFLVAATLLITSCNPDEATPTVKEYGKMLLFHGAPGAANLDIYVDGTKGNSTTVAYTNNSGYFNVEAGTTTHKILFKTASGTTVDSSSIKVNKDVGYSYYAYVDNDAAKTTRVLASTDNFAAPTAGKAKIRLVHLISDITNNIGVDVEAVTPGGVASSRNDFTNVKFKDVKDFIEIAKGTYDLKVKLTGTTNLILTVPNVSLTDGKIYTLVANGLSAKLVTDAQGPKITTINNN